MRSSIHRLLPLVAASFSLLSCSDGKSSGDSPPEALGTEQGALQNGTIDNDPTGSLRAVVAIRRLNNVPSPAPIPAFIGDGIIGGCTGTLIAPRLVLTAAHCVFPLATKCLPTPAAFGTEVVFGGLDGTLDNVNPSGRARVQAVIPHPQAYSNVAFCGQTEFTTAPQPSPEVCQNNNLLCEKTLFCPNVQDAGTRGLDYEFDIALLVLKDDAPADVRPIPVLLDNTTSLAQVVNAASINFTTFKNWVTNPQNTSPAPTTPLTNVLLVGYGTGSVGRDVGITTLSSYIGGTQHWNTCSTLTANAGPGRLNSNAIGAYGALTNNGTAGAAPYLNPGQSLPNVNESWSAPGDSGGPMFAGTTTRVFKGGLTTSPLPGNPTINPNALYLVGVDSVGYTGGGYHAATVHPVTSPWLASQLKDSDGDGVPDASDNCPQVANADQADADQDGLGNKCDLACPCSPTDDGDGVCDSCLTNLPADSVAHFCMTACQNAVVDNCVGIKNADQRNCNLAAEQKQGSLILGDACDPVPCPAFVPKPTTISTQYGQTTYLPGGGVSIPFTSVVQNNDLSLTLLGSHGASNASGSVHLGDHLSVTVGETRYRYCTNLGGTFPIACDDPSWVGKDGVIDQAEAPESGWHRVSMSSLTSYNGFDANRTYGPNMQFDVGWHWQGNDPASFTSSDFKRWATNWPNSPFATLGVPAQPDEGRGRFWINAKTTVGTTTITSAGSHKQLNGTQAPALLANHYESFAPIESRSGSMVFDKPILQIPAQVSACDPVGCPSDLGIPSLDNCPQCLLDPRTAFTHYNSLPWAVYDPQQTQSLGALTLDGSFIPLNQNLSTSLQQRMTQGLVWAGGIESSLAIGSSSTNPMMLGLSADGTQVVERVVMLRRGMFTTSADRSEASLPASRTTPTTRVGFASVYARSTGQIFLIGGKDTSNVLRGDIWSRSLTSTWVQWAPTLVGTSTPYVVGEVLAATRSYRDQCLYVLDTPAGTTQVRLVRIGLRQEVEVLGSWPRTNTTDRRWLSLDRDGGVLLTIARDSSGQTKVFRIDNPSYIGTPPTVAGLQTLTGALKFMPRVDDTTYWFVATNASDQTPAVQHPARLVLAASSWAQLGASF